MTEYWSLLANQYTYYEGATSQTLLVRDVCQPSPNTLYILGKESRTIGGASSSDADFSLYSYNAITHELTLVREDILSIITAATFGPGGLYTYTHDTSTTRPQFFVGTTGYGPVAIFRVRLKNGYLYYDTTIIVSGLTGSIIYESYLSGDAEVWESIGFPGFYQIVGAHFCVYTFGGITHLYRKHSVNFPNWMLYENSSMGIQVLYSTSYPGLTGSYKLLANRDYPSTTAKIGSGGVYYYGRMSPEWVGAVNYGRITILKDIIDSINGDAETSYNNGDGISFVGASPILRYKRRITNQTWLGPGYGTISSSETGEIKTPGGRVLHSDTDYSSSINAQANVYFCSSELFWSESFFKSDYYDNNELFYISLENRVSNDGFNSRTSGTCESDVDTYWNRYKIRFNNDNSQPFFMYITDTPIVLTLLYTDTEAGNAFLTYASPVGPQLNIGPLAGPKSFKKAFYVGGDIIIFENFYSNTLYYVSYSLPVNAEPTSITLLDDTVSIGGKMQLPEALIGGGATTVSGISTSGMLENSPKPPMSLTYEVPNMPSEGLYQAAPYVKMLSTSGTAYVKNYFGNALVHGNILPFRAVLTNTLTFEDVSESLPSGIIINSVEIGEDTYLCGANGDIYTSSGLDNWSLYSIINSIQTSLLSYADEFYAATPGAANSLVRATNLDSPSFQGTDTGLPAGVTILDIEEDIWADR